MQKKVICISYELIHSFKFRMHSALFFISFHNEAKVSEKVSPHSTDGEQVRIVTPYLSGRFRLEGCEHEILVLNVAGTRI